MALEFTFWLNLRLKHNPTFGVRPSNAGFFNEYRKFATYHGRENLKVLFR
jgi:hypothetical protein